MTVINGIQEVGLDKGKGISSEDKMGMFLKVFSGEVLTAFERRTVAQNNHVIRSIPHGKAATFPVLGRTTARYLASGESLDTGRTKIDGTEKTITIDGLLVSDVMISDIEDAMNHFEVRGEYSKQLGEALALSFDGSVLAEVAIGCNLQSAKNENIAGLGSPVIIESKTTNKAAITGSSYDSVVLGKEILEMLAKAQAKLDEQYVPTGERYFYCTPSIYATISTALLPTGANFSALANPQSGTLSNVFGFEIIPVPHLTRGGSGDKHQFPASSTGSDGSKVGKDNVIGLFHHRSAIGTVKLRDLKMERARRAEYQADMIVAKYSMGHGLLRPEAIGALIAKQS